MHASKKFLSYIRTAEQVVCFVAFAAMATILMIDVAMREFIGLGWYGAGQRAVFAMVIVVFLALGLATADGTHLRPRFADALIPARWEAAVNRFADLITAVFYIAVAVIAVFAVQETYRLDERSSTLRWPVWPFQAIIIVAFGLSGIRQVIYFVYPPLRPQDPSVEHASVAAITVDKDAK